MVTDPDTTRPGPGPPPGRLLDEVTAVRQLLRAVDTVWQSLAARADMRVVEIQALELLHVTRRLPSGQIGARTGLTPPGVTGLIDRLEQRDWVRRLRHRDNRRVVLVELTAPGRELTEWLFGSLVELVEQAAHTAEVPGLEVRVQCLTYTAELLRQAATTPPPPRPGCVQGRGG